MKNYISVGTHGSAGFGATLDDAKYDAYVNDCRLDIENDTSCLFKKRRSELEPWLPVENVCHITGVGALYYNKGFISETSSGKSMSICRSKYATYFYMATLFGTKLSYEDITVVLRPEINKFLHNINPEIVPIEKWPFIKLVNSDNGFKPEITYSLDNGLIIGITQDSVGMKHIGDELYHAVDITDESESIFMLSYIAYKMGCVLGQDELLVKE